MAGREVSKNLQKRKGNWLQILLFSVLLGAGVGSTHFLSLIIKPMSEELGVSRTAVSSMVSIMSVMTVLGSAVWGKISGVMMRRSSFIIAGILLPASFIGLSLCNSMALVYPLSIGVGGSCVVFSFMCLSGIVREQMPERSAFALSVLSLGSALGGMLFSWLGGIWLAAYGWRAVFRLTALAQLVTLTPASIICLRGGTKKPSAVVRTEKKARVRIRPRVWGVVVCMTGLMIANVAMMYALPSHAMDLGFSEILAANLGVVRTGASVLVMLWLGKVIEERGVKTYLYIVLSCGVVGMGLFLVSKSVPVLLSACLINGLSTTVTSLPVPFLLEKLCDERSYQTGFGFVSAGSAVAGVVAPMLGNLVYDLLGSYQLLLLGVFVMYTLFGIALMLCCFSGSMRLQWQRSLTPRKEDSV